MSIARHSARSRLFFELWLAESSQRRLPVFGRCSVSETTMSLSDFKRNVDMLIQSDIELFAATVERASKGVLRQHRFMLRCNSGA